MRLNNFIFKGVLAILIALGVTTTLSLSSPSLAFAAQPASTACVEGQIYDTSSRSCITPIKPGGLPTTTPDEKHVQKILEIVFGIIGALAFLMVVISGLRYVLSGGDPSNISKAKNALIYSLVGLLIAITAQAIIVFVIGKIK